MARKIRSVFVLCACLMTGGLLLAKGDNMTVNERRPAAAGELYALESAYGAEQTVLRVKEILKELQIPVFAEFDHARNAREVQLEMPPATVIVFGSPAVGTRLMQQNPEAAAVLPLKILVWEDSAGVTRAGFVRMELLAARYGLGGNPVIGKMKTLLENIVMRAVSKTR